MVIGGNFEEPWVRLTKNDRREFRFERRDRPASVVPFRRTECCRCTSEVRSERDSLGDAVIHGFVSVLDGAYTSQDWLWPGFAAGFAGLDSPHPTVGIAGPGFPDPPQSRQLPKSLHRVFDHKGPPFGWKNDSRPVAALGTNKIKPETPMRDTNHGGAVASGSLGFAASVPRDRVKPPTPLHPFRGFVCQSPAQRSSRRQASPRRSPRRMSVRQLKSAIGVPLEIDAEISEGGSYAVPKPERSGVAFTIVSGVVEGCS